MIINMQMKRKKQSYSERIEGAERVEDEQRERNRVANEWIREDE